jgi:hypothetical protein
MTVAPCRIPPSFAWFARGTTRVAEVDVGSGSLAGAGAECVLGVRRIGIGGRRPIDPRCSPRTQRTCRRPDLCGAGPRRRPRRANVSIGCLRVRILRREAPRLHMLCSPRSTFDMGPRRHVRYAPGGHPPGSPTTTTRRTGRRVAVDPASLRADRGRWFSLGDRDLGAHDGDRRGPLGNTQAIRHRLADVRRLRGDGPAGLKVITQTDGIEGAHAHHADRPRFIDLPADARTLAAGERSCPCRPA